MLRRKSLGDMTNEELWQLFPIVLTPFQKCWKEWFDLEYTHLTRILPERDVVRISHIGSTAVGTIWAKPTVDILAEVSADADFSKIKKILLRADWLCMSEQSERLDLNKGYTPDGFADKVFHLHVRRINDNDELYFRDWLRDHPSDAAAYEKLKLSLWKIYEHDRDAYTSAKGDFIREHTAAAKRAYADRYSSG